MLFYPIAHLSEMIATGLGALSDSSDLFRKYQNQTDANVAKVIRQGPALIRLNLSSKQRPRRREPPSSRTLAATGSSPEPARFQTARYHSRRWCGSSASPRHLVIQLWATGREDALGTPFAQHVPYL
jgi:hypothetical protein